jgi:hypothetical protein
MPFYEAVDASKASPLFSLCNMYRRSFHAL